MLSKSDKVEITNISNLVKQSAQYITNNSFYVKIDTQKLEEYTSNNLSKLIDNYPTWSSCHFEINKYDIETIIAYICVIDSLNFCFWPTNLLGIEFEYGDLVNSLNNMLVTNKNFFKADYLSLLKQEELQQILNTKCKFPLIEERCRSINEIGRFIVSNYNSSFENLILSNVLSSSDNKLSLTTM